MDEGQVLSNQTKKRLALVSVGIILLAAIAGFLWPSGDQEPAQPQPEPSVVDEQETETPSPDPDPDEPQPETEPLNDNDRLLVETYGLELPISVRSREIILETHQLLTDFERVTQEINEFADPTRHTCQQLEAAINPEGSGPGKEMVTILTKLFESDIGPQFLNTSTSSPPDLPAKETQAIATLVQKFANIDGSATTSRLADCGLENAVAVRVGLANPTPPNPQKRNEQIGDVGKIAAAVNIYISNRNALPDNRADIEPHINNLLYYSPDRINAAGSWDGANLPSEGSFAWDEGYNSPPAPQSAGAAISQASLAHGDIFVINHASCQDDSQLPISGSRRQSVIVYRLEGDSTPSCRDI